MKSLKKKICVSVFLDELFQAVDENEKSYICDKLDKIREGDTGVVRSQLISEEILFQSVTRPRKYRNSSWISQRGRVHFRDQILGLQTQQDWRPPVVEKVDRETETDLKGDDDNDFDVDEYSLSDLNLEGLDLGENKGESSLPRKAKKVDIALSTCFTEGLSNAEGSILEMNFRSGAQPFEQAKKLDESTQTDSGYSESERVCKKWQKIVEDISQNNKCFLVGRCAKSMNLAAWTNKSTQLGLETSLNPEQVNTVEEVNEKGSELREVYHYMKSRKYSVNTLKRANHVLTNRSIRTPEVAEMKHDVIGDFFQREEKWGCPAEDVQSNIMKKGFCDVTVKTFVKSNREHILCYTIIVPWELTNYGELIIPEDNLRYRHRINDSLTQFIARPRDMSELGCFFIGTQCINALGRCWGYSSNIERFLDTSISERQVSGAVIEELPCGEESGEERQTEEELKARSEPETEESDRDETSNLEEQKVVESLAPEITEQMKLLEMKKEGRPVADKSMNTESQTKSDEDDVSVQWELEIEIQNEKSSGVKDAAQTGNSNTQMIKAIEGPSHTNVILICQTPYENSLVIEDCSQRSRPNEYEQCYLKDEKIRKMYLANVPRRLLNVTEQRLKEIGRS